MKAHIIVRNDEEKIFSYDTDSIPRLEDILVHVDNSQWKVTRVQRDIIPADGYGGYREFHTINILVVPADHWYH